MSGHIRRQLGVTSARLRTQMDLAIAEAPYAADQNLNNNANLLRAQAKVLRFQRHTTAVQRSLDRLNDMVDQWNKILAELDPDDYEAEEQLFEQANENNQFLDNMDEAETLLPETQERLHLAQMAENALRQAINNAVQPGQAPPPANVAVPAVPAQPRIRLPELKPPRFDGDYRNWSRFWEIFEVTVHQSNLADVQKLSHLSSLLDKEAKTLVDAYEVTDANYDTVIRELRTKYDRPQQLTEALFHDLNNLPHVGQSVSQFKSLILTVERVQRQLRHLNIDIPVTQVEISIENKLSRKLLEKFIDRKRGTNPWNMEALFRVVNEMAVDMERVDSKLGDVTKPKTAGRTLAINQTNSPPNAPFRDCLFCSQTGHLSRDCLKFKTPTERREQLKKLGKCFRCLKLFKIIHQSSRCEATCRECAGNHHWILCPKLFGDTPPKVAPKVTNKTGKPKPKRPHKTVVTQQVVHDQDDPDEQVQESDSESINHTLINHQNQTLLPTIKVTLINPQTHKELTVTALLDSASDVSYLRHDCAKSLGLDTGPPKTFTAEVFADNQHRTIVSGQVKVNIRLQDKSIQELHLITVPHIVSPLVTVQKVNGNLQQTEVSPDMLVGINYLLGLLGWAGRTVTDKLTKFDTKLGSLYLDRQNKSTRHHRAFVARHHPNDSDLEKDKLIEKTYWDLECMGINEEIDEKVSDQVHRDFLNGIKQGPDGRYSMNWPFNGRQFELPTNINLSFWRLKSTMKKLRQNQHMMDQFREIFDGYFRDGILEKVTTKPKPGTIVSYLPYQAVPKKSKIRIVTDPSAKTPHGLCVNQTLYDGPMLLPNMIGLLIRMRIGNYMSSQDVQDAFLNVGLNPDQRDLVRILVPRHWDREIDENNVQVAKYSRLPFGTNAAPSCLAMVLQHHLRKYRDTEDLMKYIYVDNVILVEDEPEKLFKETKRFKDIFSDAAMNLREQYSNYVPINDALNPTPETYIKLFGLQWHFHKDNLQVHWKLWDDEKLLTKRTALRFIASIYDPLGLLTPMLLPFKLYLQKLWEAGVSWDEAITGDLKQEWHKLTQTLITPQQFFEVPRKLTPKNGDKELFIFVDASDHAYGAVAYLRQANTNDPLALTFSRSRLAPPDRTSKKTLTIPRKELLSLLCGVRLAKNLRKEVKPISEITVFSDSQIVLNQLQMDSNKEIFVKNRIKEINECRSFIEFRYVRTHLNPADLVTKTQSPEALQTNTLWRVGPDFIVKDKNEWPNEIVIPRDSGDANKLECEEDGVRIHTLVSLAPDPIRAISWKIGKWNKILMTVNYVIKFANRFGKLTQFTENPELLIWKTEQTLFPPTQKLIQRYNLFKDEHEVWRLHTRLTNSDLPTEQIYPIWVPPESPMTHSLVLHYHEHNLHHGQETVLAKLRCKYWINKRQVKSAIKKCIKCRPFTAVPFQQPHFAQLPASRVTIGKPFQFVGVDILGPLRATDGPVYILLFSCLKVRCVHLEVLTSMTTKSVIDGFTKFFARRGNSTFVLSDNAKYFIAAADILKKQFVNELEWQFITPRAPWRGGSYEIMNKSIKAAFRRTFGRSKKTVNEYEVLACAIEATMNDRPLMVMDENENAQILRPVDFLRPNGLEYKEEDAHLTRDDLISDEFVLKKSVATELAKTHQSQILALNKLWARWLQEYLPSLMEKNANPEGHGLIREPKPGEVVIIEEPDMPRGSWKLGRIKRMITSKDGVIRTAEVLLPGLKLTKRAINQLFPLEIGGEVDGEELALKVPPEMPSKIRRNPPRAAKTRALTKNLLTTIAVSLLVLDPVLAQQPMICAGKVHRTLWKTPKLHKCLESDIKDDLLTLEFVELYKPNILEYKSQGTICRYASARVEQSTTFGGAPVIREIEIPAEPMTESTCRAMATSKGCKYGSLLQGSTIWQTNNAVKIDPPNRFLSLSGPRVTDKHNCILQQTTVFAHHGKSQASSSAADLTHCEYTRGACQTKTNEFVFWRPNMTITCDYVKFYAGPAMVSENSLIVKDFHLMLTFNRNKTVTSCSKSLIQSEQGLAWRHCEDPRFKSTQNGTNATNVSSKYPPKRRYLLGNEHDQWGRPLNTTTSTQRPLPTTSQTVISYEQWKQRTNSVSYATRPTYLTSPATRPTSTARPLTTLGITTRSYSAPTFTTRTYTPPTTTGVYIRPQTTPQIPTSSTPIRPAYKRFLSHWFLDDEKRIKYGITEAKLRENGFTEDDVVELRQKLQRKQSITNQPVTDNFNILMDQIIRHKRDSDPMLAGDEQFLEHDLQKKLKHLAQITCQIINDHAEYMEQLISVSPTEAMRKLLKRNNLIARRVNSEVSEIEFCHTLAPTHYQFLPNTDNCSLPVKVVNYTRVLYLDRQTMELHSDSRRAIDEDCGEDMFLSLNNSVWTYNRNSGQLTIAHDSVPENKTVHEDWQFINSETIIRDILIRDTYTVGLQEEVLDEISRAAENEAEVYQQEQTVLEPHGFVDDYVHTVLLWYLRPIWIGFVTVGCIFQWSQLMCIIKDYATGNNHGNIVVNPSQNAPSQRQYFPPQDLLAAHYNVASKRVNFDFTPQPPQKQGWFSKSQKPIIKKSGSTQLGNNNESMEMQDLLPSTSRNVKKSLEPNNDLPGTSGSFAKTRNRSQSTVSDLINYLDESQ